MSDRLSRSRAEVARRWWGSGPSSMPPSPLCDTSALVAAKSPTKNPFGIHGEIAFVMLLAGISLVSSAPNRCAPPSQSAPKSLCARPRRGTHPSSALTGFKASRGRHPSCRSILARVPGGNVPSGRERRRHPRPMHIGRVPGDDRRREWRGRLAVGERDPSLEHPNGGDADHVGMPPPHVAACRNEAETTPARPA